ncbi:MAG: DNA polymerase III subunit gamma/tau [Muribaculaceae bacterium]|nr:DNA polymerase III subunit gamma/tau [Muribaculaceae bacterium]
MEQYIVSARKYRPSTFDSVVGQQALTSTLKNAIVTDRLAHAYLFCGSRGVGKTSCARIFAKTINCTNRTSSGEACNECDSCRQFNENRSMNILELDAASHNGVDEMRALIEQVMVPPSIGRYRVFIIDEVHMLSTQAFNAFLKTLEEPPSYVVFILATTEKHKIIPTILSRCQIYDFNRISISDMVNHLQKVAQQEGISAEASALNLIAQKADGAMRDALSIFDQVAASSRGNITYAATIENLNLLDSSYYTRLLEAFVAQDVATALLIYKEIRSKGFDSQFFINGLGLYMRDLMLAMSPTTMCLLEAPDDEKQRMAEQASKLHPTFIYKAMDLCNDADFNFRQATNKQFLIELTLIKLCQLLSPSPDESGSDEGHLKPLEDYAKSPIVAPQTTPATTSEPQVREELRQIIPTISKPAKVEEHASYTPGGFSLRSAKVQPEEATPEPEKVQTEQRSTPFSDADFNKAWDAVKQTFPSEPMLTSILVAAIPKRAKETTFGISVASDIQAQVLNKFLPTIVKQLQDNLLNDSLAIEVAVCEGDTPPSFWTEQHVLEHIIAKYPDVSEMIAKYKMRLV